LAENERKSLKKASIRDAEKPRLTIVSDPAEIAAIRRNDLADPIGGCVAGTWYAYVWSLERWRAKRATHSSSEVRNDR
jgi:hypothetical protein